ncbi:hypothetical protein [Aeromonas veronii]|uniref:hypothetical protein n=1 Tax=Aeromonas veronii TaxID=654 RepID=UPI002446760A|nr:hypothetical protein [Aeromonas veronii]
MPLEVKTGVRPDYAYAGQQAVELKRYLSEEVLGQDTFASRLYRGLFIRQVLMQVDKLCLYGMLERAQLQPLLGRREWWMRGDYQLGTLPDYVEAMVVAHVENDSCFKPSYQTTMQNVLQIELPYSLLPALIASKMDASFQRLVEQCQVPRQFCLMPQREGEVAQPPREGEWHRACDRSTGRGASGHSCAVDRDGPTASGGGALKGALWSRRLS